MTRSKRVGEGGMRGEESMGSTWGQLVVHTWLEMTVLLPLVLTEVIEEQHR
jgi:hypothetical protein